MGHEEGGQGTRKGGGTTNSKGEGHEKGKDAWRKMEYL